MCDNDFHSSLVYQKLDKIIVLLDYRYMNPNVSQLDPKLKETYDRVMGFKVSGTQTQQPAPAGQSPLGGAQPQPLQPVQPAAPAPEPTIVNVAPETVIKANQPGKKGLSPVVFAVLGLIFLAAYTFLWLKVFNVTF